MSALVYRERPADAGAAGLLVLHHGRGADEQDLLGLADVLDPQRRLHVVTPRAPLAIQGWPGYHWYSSRGSVIPTRRPSSRVRGAGRTSMTSSGSAPA